MQSCGACVKSTNHDFAWIQGKVFFCSTYCGVQPSRGVKCTCIPCLEKAKAFQSPKG